MATTEQFSLRWNNFHSNLTNGFHDLLEASEMVDVTLGVDGQYLQAHKLVLSICSPYFKQLFKLNPCKHPIVILKDVTHGNLKDILQFMYLGEVNVLRENLPSFLRTAELLQVKGLTGDDSSDTSSKKDERLDSLGETEEEQDQYNLDAEDSAQYPLKASPPARHSSFTSSSQKRASKNSQGNANAKKTKSDCNYNQTPSSAVLVKSELGSGNAEEEESDFIMAPKYEYSENEDGFNVKESNKASSGDREQQGTGSASGEVLTLQDQGSGQKSPAKFGSSSGPQHQHPYKCEHCVKRFSRRDHLRTHEKNIHGEDAGPFACVICSQLYKNSESLRKHIAKFHYAKADTIPGTAHRNKSMRVEDGY